MDQHYARGWIKHLDFIILDLLVMQASFLLSFYLRMGHWRMLESELYRGCAVLLLLADIVRALAVDDYKSVLRRGRLKELGSVLRVVLFNALSMITLLFLLKQSAEFSRLILIRFCVIAALALFPARLLWKRVVIARRKRDSYHKKHLLLLTSRETAGSVLNRVTEHSLGSYEVVGLILPEAGENERISGVPVVCGYQDAPAYMRDKWIDEVMIDLPEDADPPVALMNQCAEMGITTHLRLQEVSRRAGTHTIQEYAGCLVLTESIRTVPPGQLLMKRIMDLCGAVVGLLITGLLTLVIGPIIYVTDPGPIFFKQKRIGQNGRTFTIYKFRSMYRNAEMRKEDLMSENTLRGPVFKLDRDPRILGSGPDGTRHGIGWFIRRTSIDEFPQFLNVLKGEMSMVGPRPPLPEEWEQYEWHHRARLSVRPGLTGLWQVSGRNKIKDFEQVVALDMQYINNWNTLEDIRIIIRTLRVILTGEGAQ